MTIAPVVAAELWFGSVKLTCGAQSISWTADAESLDATTFCSAGWKQFLGGAKGGTVQFDGFADYTAPTNGIAPDKDLFDNLAAAAAPVSVAVPAAGGTAVAVGDPGYTAKSLVAGFDTFGDVNAIAKLEGEVVTTGAQARGAVLAIPSTTITSTGSGTGVQLGALSSTQTLYVALHVFTAVTGTVTVKVQSDDNSGFTSATDRVTFTSAGSAGWQWGTVSGAVTDDYWRAVWTVAGGGSYTFGVVAGIA